MRSSKGTLTEEQARSVHHSTYTHADLERLGTGYPILPLRRASDVARQRTRKVGGECRTGWPAQRHTHTEEIAASLAA